MKSWTKRFLLGLMACVVTFSVPLESHAAARLRTEWYYSSTPRTVYFRLQGFNSQQEIAIINSFGVWNSVKNYQDKTMISFVRTANSQCDNVIYTVNQPGNGVAAYCQNYPVDGGAITFTEIRINLGYRTSIGATINSRDFQSLVEHELGHALGVAHCHKQGASSCFSSTDTRNVMNPDVPYGSNRRTLTEYDIGSYQAIYR